MKGHQDCTAEGRCCERGWGQREMDPSIRGYNEREQLPATVSDSTQMWGSLGAQQTEGGHWSPTTNDLIPSQDPSTAQPYRQLTWTHCSGAFWAVRLQRCLVKLWMTCGGKACQTLSCNIKYSQGWLHLYSLSCFKWSTKYIKSSIFFFCAVKGHQKCGAISLQVRENVSAKCLEHSRFVGSRMTTMFHWQKILKPTESDLGDKKQNSLQVFFMSTHFLALI